ncbi:hypothetical protein PMNALOAF_2908 [Methylobacterium adhaesivum]|jgi:hypothetical protein|nr:hypothetical protein PMNALOAF_2908 [Methylobacterium adhaesivum]
MQVFVRVSPNPNVIDEGLGKKSGTVFEVSSLRLRLGVSERHWSTGWETNS